MKSHGRSHKWPDVIAHKEPDKYQYLTKNLRSKANILRELEKVQSFWHLNEISYNVRGDWQIERWTNYFGTANQPLHVTTTNKHFPRTLHLFKFYYNNDFLNVYIVSYVQSMTIAQLNKVEKLGKIITAKSKHKNHPYLNPPF